MKGNSNREEYDSIPEYHLETKDVSTLKAMIRGIENAERSRAWWNAANKHDAERRIKDAIRERMSDLKE